MFPLAGGPWPSTVEQLRLRLLEGTRSVVNETPRVAVSGDWPVLSELTLDLGGVRIDPATEWPQPRPTVERSDGPGCRQLRVFANPLRWGDIAQPKFNLRVSDIQFEFVRDEAGRHWIRPVTVGGGSIEAEITGAELDRFFLEGARKLARKQGITIDDATIKLEPAGPNTIRVEAEVGARKVFLKGRLRFAGTAELGPTLEVHLRGLQCDGVGTIGSIAARAVQPQLERLALQPLRPFGSLVSGLTLEHLEFRHGDGDALELEARIAPHG
jgi:hypothetical protein